MNIFLVQMALSKHGTIPQARPENQYDQFMNTKVLLQDFFSGKDRLQDRSAGILPR